MLHTGPTATTVQLSWQDGRDQAFFLAVLAKRSYVVDDRGRLLLAPEQAPFLTISGDTARDGCLENEADLYPYKPLTDVVVQGHAYPPRPGETSFIAKVQLGPVTKSLSIVGDRKAALSRNGSIVFSTPEPFEKMPLTYDRAYGGIDRVAEQIHGNPMMVFDKYRRAEFQPEYHSPFIYPRNAAGRGYLVERTPEGIEALQLPNIEDPDDPIAKRELAVGNVYDWPRMPLPWGTNWLHPAYFPRAAYLGVARRFTPMDEPWPEVRRGFAPEGWPQLGAIEAVADNRFFNAGSLGLQLPPLGGDLSRLELRLTGMQASGRDFTFRLPAVPPRIAVDGRNRTLKDTLPVLHHVVVRPDEGMVHVVWRGHAPALRPYQPEELEKMPYKVEWD